MAPQGKRPPRHFSAAQHVLKLGRCQLYLPAISILPAPATFAISAAIPPKTLILHALGVPHDLIAEDYLLTNRFYRRDPAASPDLPEEVRQALASVKASFLAAAFEVISADYGDLERYLGEGLGLRNGERERLQARYLES
jgi:hypothetical protein